MHFGLFVWMYVCLSGRATEKSLLRLTRFFTQEILYSCLGPSLRLCGSGFVSGHKNLLFMNSSPFGDRTKYAIKECHRPLSRRLDRCERVIQDESGDSNRGNV